MKKAPTATGKIDALVIKTYLQGFLGRLFTSGL
jgi:hypothetical protein